MSISYKTGTRVRVWNGDRSRELGPGTITGSEATPLGETPVIALDSGDTLRGYECWWAPLGEEAAPSRVTLTLHGSRPAGRYRLEYHGPDDAVVVTRDAAFPPALMATIEQYLDLATPAGWGQWGATMIGILTQEIHKQFSSSPPIILIDQTDPA